MSLDNTFGLNSGWKTDPDGRYDRSPGPVTTYKLTPEEIAERYGHLKTPELRTVISNIDGEQVKNIRARESEEKNAMYTENTKMNEVTENTESKTEEVPTVKLTKAGVLKMKEEGKSIDEIAECFMPTWNGKAQLLKAKITLYLSGKKSGKPRKVKSVISETNELPAKGEQLSDSDLPPVKELTEKEILTAFFLDSLPKDSSFDEQYNAFMETHSSPVQVNTESDLLGHLSDERCPRCGSHLLINARGDKWCSFVGGSGEAACTYRLEPDATVEKEIAEGTKKSMNKLNAAKEVDLMMEMVPEDEINHPKHYLAGGIETTDYIQAKLTPEGFEGFCIGTALQYLSRYRLKGGLQDLKKAEWYLNRIIRALESA